MAKKQRPKPKPKDTTSNNVNVKGSIHIPKILLHWAALRKAIIQAQFGDPDEH